MHIPENPSNNDIREALIQLGDQVEGLSNQVERLEHKFDEKIERLEHKFDEKIERLDYKFDTYQKGTDGMVRMATTIIIATASVIVLSNLSPAVTALFTTLSSANGQ